MSFVSDTNAYTSMDKALLALGLILSFLFGYLVFGPSRSQFNLTGLSQIGNLETSAGVKRRHAKALEWEEVRKSTPVYTKDLVYTPADSSAEVKLADNRILVLEPDSLVEFEAMTSENFEIVLLKGSGKIKSTDTKKEVPLKVVETPVVQLDQKEPLKLPQFFVNVQTWAQAQNEYVTKASVIPKISELLEVKKLEALVNFSLSDFVIELLPPQRELASSQENPWYQLRWTSVPLSDVSYEIKISRTGSFKRSVEQELKGSQVPVQFLEPGKHYYKVVAKQKDQKQETQSQAIHITEAGEND